jgi:hypothetical protein
MGDDLMQGVNGCQFGSVENQGICLADITAQLRDRSFVQVASATLVMADAMIVGPHGPNNFTLGCLSKDCGALCELKIADEKYQVGELAFCAQAIARARDLHPALFRLYMAIPE